MGLIAGGMDNGTIHIWNPLDIMNGNNGNSKDNAADNDKALLSTIDRQSNGAISALQFNPHPDSANLLATGSSNGEILISSLDTPDQPTVTIPSETQTTSTSSITSLAWNTEVSHIIASALSTGSVTIWDLRQNKPWCSLQCESSNSRSPVNAICWNPGNGMHLLTASGDDHCPVLKLWDLRASMSMPLATMEGHGSGVLGMDWCPHDESLVISCGKDNRTILWDVNSLSMICDLPNEEVKEVVNDVNGTKDKVSSQELYGNAMPSGLISNQQKRYDVKWSPLRRGVISTCSFDRKVQAHSVLSAATKSGRPPKWMKPASGVSCGFGGKIVSFGTLDKTLRLEEYVEQPDLKKQVEEFERAVAAGNANGSGNGIGDYEGFATAKALECANSVPSDVCEAQLWGFIQCMFKENSRMAMLQYLGFDAGEIAEKAKAFEHQQDITNSNGIGMSNLSLKESGATMPMTKEAQDAVNQALLVGNFEAAVECCIRAGSLADALVLASCGGAELWAKTQAQYFASEMGKRPFLSVVSAVIHNNLGEYVTSSDPANWYETLALICTYSSEQEFTVLCEALGDHLEEAGDTASASVCFQCSMNLEKTARFWLWQLENVGGDYLALHDFVVKVSVFMQTGAQGSELSDDVAEAMYRYAKVLADQGLFASAAKYCRSNSQECKELKDRLYRSKDSQICLQLMGATPDFPYQYVNIGVSPIAPVVSVNHQQQHVVVAKPVKQQQPVYARTQNQYQAQPTAAAVTNGYGSSSQAYGNNTQQQQQQQAVQQPQQQYVQQPVQQHNTGHYATQQQPMLAPAPTQVSTRSLYV
jgi:protein transport protein SEC31